MTVRIQTIVSLALLFLLAAGNVSLFAQTTPTIRPPTREEAIESRSNSYIRARERREAEANAMERAERDRIAWEREQRRLAEEEERRRIEAIRNRPSSDRKTNPGFQSPTELNRALDALRPGDSMELHGDLFTAFDGMILSATYYRGAAGKDSVPVVLLHGLGGSRSDFDPIIPALLEEGMAVLVPDIRGHGKSIEYIVEEFGDPYPRYYPEFPFESIPENPFINPNAWLPNRWTEYERMSADVAVGRFKKPPTKISVKRSDKYDKRDFGLMVFDLQVWQNFLANENNQERLNIRKLNLVGTEMGARLATHWCRWDQSGMKQTKTLTLISPVIPANALEAEKGNGVNLAYLKNNAMKNSLSTMIIAGKDNQRFLQDAEKVKEALLVKGKVDNKTGLDAVTPLLLGSTEKQGSDLFSLTSLRIDRGIRSFILDRLQKLEKEAATKKNDKSLVWTAGNWNKKVTPPPPKEK